MENENITKETELKQTQPQQKISTPVAIIIAGVIIMVGILLTNGGNVKTPKEKTLSEQVGVNKEDLKLCLNETDIQKLIEDTSKSADLAMKAVPSGERGTPYSVIVGKNGSKLEVRGALSIDAVRALVDEVLSGQVKAPYQGEIPEVTSSDHIIGNPDAPVVIIEYSDLECPYCKKFGEVMKQLVAESNGQVAWVYRHWIVHQGAINKTAAAECVAKLKGEEAFWKYIDLVFGLMKTSEDVAKEEQDQL